MKSSTLTKMFLSLFLLAISLIVLVNYFSLHSDNHEKAGAPCLFEVVTRTECIGETGNLVSADYHFSSLSNVFTATADVSNLLLVLVALAVVLATLTHVPHDRYDLYVRVIMKQRWKDGQSLEKLFDPIKTALRSGILKRKEEPSSVIA